MRRATIDATLHDVSALHAQLLAAIEPFVRYDPKRCSLDVVLGATGIVRIPAGGGGGGTLAGVDGDLDVSLLPFRNLGSPTRFRIATSLLFVEHGTADLRGAVVADEGRDVSRSVLDLLDVIFGYVAPHREPAHEDVLERGVIWSRPLARCELLLLVQRTFGVQLAGEIPVHFAGDRLVFEARGLRAPGGAEMPSFDPWPFATWLSTRHVGGKTLPILAKRKGLGLREQKGRVPRKRKAASAGPAGRKPR